MNTTPAKLDAARVLQLSDQFRSDARLYDMDRAELLRHYAGGALEADDTQSGAQRTRRPNILLGHKFLTRPCEQLLATYDEGLGFVEASVYDEKMIPSRRRVVEAHLNREINLVIQRSERMFWPYKATIADAVINGMGTLFRDDPYDWVPKYGRPYFAWNAPADITDDRFADWCFLGELSVSAILARLERLKGVQDEDSYWDKSALTNLIEEIVQRHNPNDSSTGYSQIDADDPIGWRERIQTQSWGVQVLKSSAKVVWFYSKRFEENGDRPIDIYCVPRAGEAVQKDGTVNRQNNPHNGVLFYQARVFEDIRQCFFPFLLSMMIGGEPLMRRTMGLGMLMYDLDIRVQQSINNMFDATDFDFSPLFQAGDSQSEAELQELAATKIHSYDILPQGAKFMEKPKGSRPYTSVFELTQLMSSEMGNQAQAFHGGGEFENKGRAELEIQVMERRQQLATALRLRMNDFIRRADPMVEAIGEVLVNESLLPTDKAYAQQQELKKCLKKCGVDWDEVKGRTTFAMRRPPGHGDPGLALYRAQQTESVARGLGPEAHRDAQRGLVAAINGGDTQLAEEYVPTALPSAGQQEQQALMQSAASLTTFMPAPILETDNPMAHLPVHMTVLQSQFSNAVQAGNKWTREQQRGFEALAAHTMGDNRVLGSFNPQAAKDVDKAVKGMISKASTFEITGGQQQVDPVEQAKLQLAARAQQLKEAKTQDDIQHRNRAQEHREEAAGFQQNLQLAQLTNSERDSEVKRATSIASTAKDLAEPTAQAV